MLEPIKTDGSETGETLATKTNAGFTKTDEHELNKVDKVQDMGLSHEDFTSDEKTKLNTIETAADVNVQVDWNESDTHSDEYILNKPIIPSVPVQSVNNKTGDVELDGSDIDLTGYAKPESSSDIDETDSVNVAIGKLEQSVDEVTDSVHVTDMAEVTSTGIFHGTDVTDSPVAGNVLIVATMNGDGDIGIEVKDDTMRVYHGGIPNGGSLYFNNVSPNHFHGVDDPLDTLGEDGDIYFKIP